MEVRCLAQLSATQFGSVQLVASSARISHVWTTRALLDPYLLGVFDAQHTNGLAYLLSLEVVMLTLETIPDGHQINSMLESREWVSSDNRRRFATEINGVGDVQNVFCFTQWAGTILITDLLLALHLNGAALSGARMQLYRSNGGHSNHRDSVHPKDRLEFQPIDNPTYTCASVCYTFIPLCLVLVIVRMIEAPIDS